MNINQWTFWGWVIRGLQGVVSMAEATVAENAQLTSEQFMHLQYAVERLHTVLIKAAEKVNTK